YNFSDIAVADWDPTIRNRFESCHSIASFAPTSEQYCKAFNMCCSMLFDPNNGDKCQTNEQRCIPLEVRHCFELVIFFFPFCTLRKRRSISFAISLCLVIHPLSVLLFTI
ncbi:unnamed protein product, partial [Angiostrongylus costaricensis]|uniref:FZ domain-containing protein n=1 Tax=Angiostrongylus costaricensis TaxID=334426 RepID=A0A0R3PBC2_ANGCS